MDEAERALRDGELAKAHVLTRRAGRPRRVDDALLDTQLAAIFRPEDFRGPAWMRAEELAPFDPERAASMLVPDNGPATLRLAWLGRAPRELQGVLPYYAIAVALERDAREAAALVTERKGEHNAALLAIRAFQLWHHPFARAAAPASFAPFLDLLTDADRRRIYAALYLSLRARGAVCAPPPPAPAPDLSDDADAADAPDFPARDPARAERILKEGTFLPGLAAAWDPFWLRERWSPDIPGYAGTLFGRLLFRGRFDAALLAKTREAWEAWSNALAVLASLHPDAAREEARRAPAERRAAVLRRVVEGEASARCFEIRLALLRKVSPDPFLTRAAFWLLLDSRLPWPNERSREAFATPGLDEPFRQAARALHPTLFPAGT